jgi:hypothetical protein
VRTTALGLLIAAAALPPAASAHEHGHAGPSVASVDVYVDAGVLHLLVGEDRPGEKKVRALYHRRSADGGATWSAPVRVDSDTQRAFPAHVGGDAQIAARGERLVAAWTGFGTGWGGSGPLAIAVSADGGRTWKPGGGLGAAGPAVAQGFADLAVDEAGVDAVWLDSLDKAQGLRHARSTDGGMTWTVPTTAAAGTCECCTNRLARDDRGALHVLYRGKGPRDLRLATKAGDIWRTGPPVGAFGWQIDACPHTGGALAAGRNGTLQALSWTGSDAAIGLYRLRSDDAGKTWSPPQRVGGESARHSDIAAASSGVIAAVWDEQDGERKLVKRTLSHDGGATWSAAETLNRSGTSAQQPRIVATPTGFAVFWIERGAGGAHLLANGVALPNASREEAQKP